MISTNFLNSEYSATGLESESLTNLIYIGTPIYYVYAVFFPKAITASFYIINPLIYTVLISSILTEIIGFIKTNVLAGIMGFVKTKKWFTYILIVAIIIFISITNIYIKPAANFDMHVLTFVMTVICVLKYKERDIDIHLIYITPTAMAFFSPTGLIISLPLVLTIFLFCLITYKQKSMLFSFLFVFQNIILIIFVFGLNINPLLNLFLFLPNALVVIYIFFSTKLTNLGEFKFKTIFNLNYFFRLVIIPLMVFILSLIYVIVFMNLDGWDKTNIVYFGIGFALLIGCALIDTYKYKTRSPITDILYFSIICIIITIPYNYFSYSLYNSDSLWRLIFLFAGISDINSFLIMIMLFFSLTSFNELQKSLMSSYLFLSISDYLSSNTFFKPFFIQTFNCMLLIPILLTVSINFFVTSVLHFQKDKTYFWKNQIFEKDRAYIEKIDFMNYSKTYLTDSPINEYLVGGVNVAPLLTRSIDPNTHWNDPHVINYFGLQNGLQFWYDKNNKNGDSINLEYIENALNSLIKRLSSTTEPIYKSITNYEITKLDYIIIANHFGYYKDLSKYLIEETFYKMVYKGIGLSVFRLDS